MNAFPVTVSCPIQWGDMDALGHVNNARYFTWFESARIALLSRAGVVADRPREMGPILATTTCDFVRPLTYPGDVVVGAGVAKLGRTSIAMEYGVWRADQPDTMCAHGSSVVVLVNYGSMAKVEVPPSVRAALEVLVALPK
jgi:acyl-CoA thioester hydrolase